MKKYFFKLESAKKYRIEQFSREFVPALLTELGIGDNAFHIVNDTQNNTIKLLLNQKPIYLLEYSGSRLDVRYCTNDESSIHLYSISSMDYSDIDDGTIFKIYSHELNDLQKHAKKSADSLKYRMLEYAVKNYNISEKLHPHVHMSYARYNDENVTVTGYIKKSFCTDEFDSRFLALNKIKLHHDDLTDFRIRKDIPVATTSIEEAIEIVNKIADDLEEKMKALHHEYNTVKMTVGGVELLLDGNKILCHKAFKPLITGGFITFKCPFTNSVVSLKSSKYDCVIVNGMDEVYGVEQSIVMIGQNT